MAIDENKQDLEEIKGQLTIEQIENLLSELDGDPQIQGNIIKSRTICHCGNSHKLYYYDNTKLFKCYTDCPEDSFDIFQLILKVKNAAGADWTLPKAVSYVIKFFNLTIQTKNFVNNNDNLQDWQILNKYEQNTSVDNNKQVVELKKYDKKILKYLPHPHIEPWESENITRDVMETYGICYNPSSQGIIIPHYNDEGELIGIRERTLIKENEANGKYKPAIINGKMYNHPLGFALYGLNWSKEQIKNMEKAIVFEGEKSVLLYASYFGIENNISVACCGSSLINYQVELLLKYGAKEIIIAYDKQFKEIGDDEWKRWKKKLTDINTKYGARVQISYIFDLNHELQYKSSPIDEGKEKFLKMFKERITI
jgi:hypothetical protein